MYIGCVFSSALENLNEYLEGLLSFMLICVILLVSELFLALRFINFYFCRLTEIGVGGEVPVISRGPRNIF